MEVFSNAAKILTAIALLLAFVALLFAAAKFFYEHLKDERLTFFNLFHPVKPITAKERYFIASFLVPYQNFNAAQKKRFLKRFAWFKSKKDFVRILFFMGISKTKKS